MTAIRWRRPARWHSPQGSGVLVNNELYVADTSNNRVIVLPLQTGNFGAATRVLGQDRFNTNSINLIEGREFFFLNGNSADAAVAIDSTGDTPHLYVSDPNNHRVLGFRDVRKLIARIRRRYRHRTARPGHRAVQLPDRRHQSAHAGQPVPSRRAAGGFLRQPLRGRLVTMAGCCASPRRFPTRAINRRTWCWASPISPRPPITDATARNMLAPYGLAFAGNNGLLVSDQGAQPRAVLPL